MTRKTLAIVGLCFGCFVVGSTQVSYAEPSAGASNCASDDTLSVCIVSAAIGAADNPTLVDAFVTLRITNRTTAPLAALIGDDMSFTPTNAPSMTPVTPNYIQVSGMVLCANTCAYESSPRFTTLSPGRALLVQIRYSASVSDSGRRMLQSAGSASFSATLRVNDGHADKVIPLPSPPFKFGNGLAMK